jgi:SOS-response transcriptional repressor LexA
VKALTLDPVPKKPARDKPPYGKRLEQRRLELGKLSMQDIDDLTHGVVYRKLQQRVESGEKHPSTLTTPEALAYAEALRWTPELFWLELGIEIGTGSPIRDPFRERHAQEWRPSLSVPLLGTVSAGYDPNNIFDFGSVVQVDPSLVRGHATETLYALVVNGNSMLSEGARYEGVRPGSTIVVDAAEAPSHGDVVVAYVPEHDLTVLKLFQEGPEAALVSINPQGPTFRAGQYHLQHRGVMVLNIRKRR